MTLLDNIVWGCSPGRNTYTAHRTNTFRIKVAQSLDVIGVFTFLPACLLYTSGSPDAARRMDRQRRRQKRQPLRLLQELRHLRLRKTRRENFRTVDVYKRQCKEEKIPVYITFDGYDGAGKGVQIGRLMQALDPRGFDVYTGDKDTEEEALRPFLWRFAVPARCV